MFLLNAGEWTGIIGAAATVLTVFIIPMLKSAKKRVIKLQQEEVDKEQQQAALNFVIEQLVEIKKENADLCTKLDSFFEDYDEFTIQNLKYMINDAFFGYNDIHDIPDEVLTNACECCDIYVNKRHKNHEIRPRCALLWEEQERRAVSREVHHE